MSRLFVFVEGYVEEEHLKRFLHFYWQQRFDDMEPLRYDGAPDLKNHFKRDAEILLKTRDWYVLCLLDVFEEPFKICKPHMSRRERFELIQKYMYKQIDPQYHARFAAIPVVMEIETWLLADPVLQRNKFRTEIAQPEDIEHPYIELKRMYPAYSKKRGGSNLFALALAQRVEQEGNCPHFVKLVEWLKNPVALVISEEQKQQDQGIQDQEAQMRQRIQDLDKRLKDAVESDDIPTLLNELITAQKTLDAFRRQHSK